MKTPAECEEFRRKFKEELDKSRYDFDPSDELLEHPNDGCPGCLKWLEDLLEEEIKSLGGESFLESLRKALEDPDPSVGDDLDSSKVLKN